MDARLAALYSKVGALYDCLIILFTQSLPPNLTLNLARISAGLWWKQRRCRRPAAAKRLASGLDMLPGKFLRGGVSSASVFEDLVLGITQLEKALKARKGISQRREDQEAALRERWALELAGHIQDAKLPCATTRIESHGRWKASLVPRLRHRRGKSLRNRARAWGSFKAWLTISYGLQWPTDSGQILPYLEKRHAATPLGRLGKEFLLPEQMALFYTGHSPRHTMPSMAAVIGVEKSRRDFLGRWAYAQHGSQDYVLCKLCRFKMDVAEPSSTSGSEDTDANAPDVRERGEI